MLTRPDITHVVQQVCLYMHDSRESHFALIKHILWYIKDIVLLSLIDGHMIWSSTWMPIGQAARIPTALLLGVVCFLEIILYHGHPSANTVSHGPVLRPNTGLLPMLCLRLVRFTNSWVSFIVLYHVLLLSIVTTSVPCICQQTQFITKGPNT